MNVKHSIGSSHFLKTFTNTDTHTLCLSVEEGTTTPSVGQTPHVLNTPCWRPRERTHTICDVGVEPTDALVRPRVLLVLVSVAP